MIAAGYQYFYDTWPLACFVLVAASALWSSGYCVGRLHEMKRIKRLWTEGHR